MNRIAKTFDQLQNRAALVPYITAGDPTPELTLQLLHEMVAAGADIIELGMPFSDPGAEGPVIQEAHEIALAQGMTLTKTIAVVKQFRKQNNHTPIILMGYLNPIEIMGYDEFCQAIADAGVDGLLVVDMPLEEGMELVEKLKKHNISTIFLLAPTTSKERMRAIVRQGSGYIYYVSLKGVTGSKALDIVDVRDKLAEIRNHTQLPIAVGFGIKDADTAKQIAEVADGVVIGSAVIKIIADNRQNPKAMLQKVNEFLNSVSKELGRTILTM